jgi:pimeloyl-ACP methyl ester carboxylesterase
MRPAHVIEIVTPKKFVLNGLWFGPVKAKRVIIIVHGLTSSAFSLKSVVDALVTKDTAVITFNNRGFEQVATVKRVRGNTREYVTAGMAHEVFTDSIDDLQGAIDFAKKAGARDVYLAGHSTGAQKCVYWASKNRRSRTVRGVILLGALSDYADAAKHRAKYAKALAYAQKLIQAGLPRELLPATLTEPFVFDAQRFVSLYTPDSAEEIFSYAQPGKTPRTLRSVTIPILALFAGDDEYADRPAEEIGSWFDRNITAAHEIAIVPSVGHSFHGGEKLVAAAVRDFIKSHS